MSVDNLDTLTGLKIESVTGLDVESELVVFSLSNGSELKMLHVQDCCECVWLADICGDVGDLLNCHIIHFEKRVSDESGKHGGDDSCTFTFYDIQTTKGSVNIRWQGESNGYYSEGVYVYLDGTCIN